MYPSKKLVATHVEVVLCYVVVCGGQWLHHLLHKMSQLNAMHATKTVMLDIRSCATKIRGKSQILKNKRV